MVHPELSNEFYAALKDLVDLVRKTHELKSEGHDILSRRELLGFHTEICHLKDLIEPDLKADTLTERGIFITLNGKIYYDDVKENIRYDLEALYLSPEYS